METLEELKQAERKIINELKDKERELRKTRIEIYKTETGFNIKDEVSINGQMGIIWDFKVQSKAYPVVLLYKKDGTIGKRFKTVYSWGKMKKL